MVCTNPNNCMLGSEYAKSIVTNNVMPSNVMSAYSTPTIPIMPAPQAASSFSWAGLISSVSSWLGTNLHWLLIALAIIAVVQLWSNYKNKTNKIETLFSIGLLLLSIWGAFCYNTWFGGMFIILSVAFIVQSENYKFGPKEEEEEVEEKVIAKQSVPQRMPIKQLPSVFDDGGISLNDGQSGIGLNLDLF